MAAEGVPFPWRWNGSMMSLNLGVIWEMSDKTYPLRFQHHAKIWVTEMQPHTTASSASPVLVKTWPASVPKLLIGAFFLSAFLLSGCTTKNDELMETRKTEHENKNYDELMKTGKIEYENKNYAAAAELFAEAGRVTDNGIELYESLQKLSLSARLSGDPVRARIAHERESLVILSCLLYWENSGMSSYCPVPDEDWAEVPPPSNP